MGRRLDITGKVYGRLTAIRWMQSRLGRAYWVCLCQCGRETVVCVDSLVTNNTRSCGCLRSEVSSAQMKARLTEAGKRRYRMAKLTVVNGKTEERRAWRGAEEAASDLAKALDLTRPP